MLLSYILIGLGSSRSGISPSEFPFTEAQWLSGTRVLGLNPNQDITYMEFVCSSCACVGFLHAGRIMAMNQRRVVRSVAGEALALKHTGYIHHDH